jgi:hypothetical protein
MTPTNHHRSSEAGIAFLVLATFVVAATLIIAVLLGLADDLGPQLGDIVAFPPNRAPSFSAAAITVSPANAASRETCVLDVQIMQRSGGSLIVEGTHSEPDRMFRVHWAGLRTSDGQEDCGRSADFLLNKVQITALIFAAGGTGVRPAQD